MALDILGRANYAIGNVTGKPRGGWRAGPLACALQPRLQSSRESLRQVESLSAKVGCANRRDALTRLGVFRERRNASRGQKLLRRMRI